MLKQFVCGVAVAITLAGAAIAGPLEDGKAAWLRGDYAATALSLWKPLADKRDASARGFLGQMFATGHGVTQDYLLAAEWYWLAAQQGDAAAQDNVGSLYELGEGMPQDYVLAHMWFNLAAAHGYEGADKDRDTVAKLMTPDQIAEAQRLAREWKPKAGN